jgi:uncharacterized protein YbbC (DUF1343 family)
MRLKRVPQSFSLVLAGLVPVLMSCGSSEARTAGEDGEAGPAADESGQVRPGVDVLLSDSLHLVRGLRVGLITNHTGVDARGRSSIDRLTDSEDVHLVSLFSPEHGIRGTQRGGDAVEAGVDAATGLPIHSLYGETRAPTPEMLDGLDALLFDIQDVGARYYTYISTMALAMEAAGKARIPFVVLDRPDPIGGVAVQGNILDPRYSTFVGLYPVPMRHGMTPGELARLFVGEFGIEAELHVVPVSGLERSMTFGRTGLPWIPPSPNIPSVESALHYPGTCLFEGTNISVARGTDRAFQLLGAPWLDGEALAEAMGRYDLDGVRIEPVRFTPESPSDGKFDGEEIPGVALTATDSTYDPTVTAVALLLETRRMSGDHWEWRISHFDRLAGTDALRKGIDAGRPLEELTEGWNRDLAAFRQTRAPYLIYP